ncbi:GNAT family N-acetyltransferase [Microbispora corallina]|uniref:GCN5 family N-acetyltransferase n=1 Tax=Microbispora corallina TaxID=83302 RepID=A0ABQ4GAC7_9ACTN|nr:GNAT family N-acetyltransferase [Microbispora corallina]GIH44005.1 GCN5 family N-acetyltransferase [Microbispora corallina]
MSIQVRAGGPGDVPVLLRMFDDAVSWLTARGSAGQWGTEPWSRDPRRIERVRGIAASGGLSIAEIDGVPAGAIAVTERPPAHIPPVDERELYVDMLITARSHTGRGVGAALLDEARAEARTRGVTLLRVDCWAGGDGDLVRYYQGQGFTPTGKFDVGGWIGQVFEQRLT